MIFSRSTTAMFGLVAMAVVALSPVVRGQTYMYNLGATSYTVVEGDGHVIIEIYRTSGDLSQPSSVLVTTLPGTASSPGDYTLLNQRRGFQSGQIIAIRIDINDDDLREGTKQFQVQISNPNPSTGTIGANSTATITIQDDDAEFSFDMIVYPQVSEAESSTTIALVRNGYLNKRVVVYISTRDGTNSDDNLNANGRLDFMPLVETPVVFVAGEDRVTVRVVILPDSIPEYTEELMAEIVRVEGGEIGGVPITTLSIGDDDVQYSISSNSFSVEERTGLNQIFVTIIREFNSQQEGTIELYTEDGTATSADGDYLTFSGRIRFEPGEDSVTQAITVLDDNVLEPTGETFYVGIRNPQPYGFVLSSASRREVNIEDNDSVLGLARSTYTVMESDESVTIQVRRTGDLSQQSSVRLRSVAVSATAGEDYTGFDEELMFPSDIQAVNVRINIVNDAVSGEGDEVFIVELYQAAVSILDSDASSAEITIQDNPRLSTLAIILIAVGSSIFVILVLIMILCCCAFARSGPPRDPFYYDRGSRNVPGVDFPQESLGRGPVVTYIPSDLDDHRRSRLDKPRRSERRANGSAIQNGGPRITEIPPSDRVSRRETNRMPADQPPPPPPPPEERPTERRGGEPDQVHVERHGEQSDPRRARSMFNTRGEREPYWAKTRPSYHSSPNHYGYF